MLRIAALALSLVATPALARDVVRIDKLSDADVQFLYRGWPDQIAHCAVDVIDGLKSISQQEHWYVVINEHLIEIEFQGDDGSKKVCADDGVWNITPAEDGGVHEVFTLY